MRDYKSDKHEGIRCLKDVNINSKTASQRLWILLVGGLINRAFGVSEKQTKKSFQYIMTLKNSQSWTLHLIPSSSDGFYTAPESVYWCLSLNCIRANYVSFKDVT